MLRITPSFEANRELVLRLEGKLTAPFVGELVDAIRFVQRDTRIVRLDLAAVTFADSAGIETLCNLRLQNIEIGTCSGIIRELLKGGNK